MRRCFETDIDSDRFRFRFRSWSDEIGRDLDDEHDDRDRGVFDDFQRVVFYPFLIREVPSGVLEAGFFDSIPTFKDSGFFDRFEVPNGRETDDEVDIACREGQSGCV